MAHCLAFSTSNSHMLSMIEISWGKPLTLVVTESGDTQKISTIEQAKYWLRKHWPIADDARQRAMNSIDGAMECMLPVQIARRAFEDAAGTAGYAVRAA
ncbi:DUF982 domain-containing protein [Paracoccus laeviglucosivorans]|uniref:DUF982 domain-containing protein n=1 Tax=Paracoccus laeviglucosivorans TaxID=1197861 RepID=A0A521E8B8_9RHOB|nr:DUF982 domain-containing protein [Paracoccus laeviglucosivorans]SMO79420.1 Protein of unknown function [Paracoccus laeviglucosivorans]